VSDGESSLKRTETISYSVFLLLVPADKLKQEAPVFGMFLFFAEDMDRKR